MHLNLNIRLKNNRKGTMLSKNHKRLLVRRGIFMFTLVPVLLGLTAVSSDYYGWNIINSARGAGIAVMLTLAARQCDAQVALALVHCPRKLACIPM